MNSKSKLVLKKMVRECLMEILSEGLGNELLENKKVTKKTTRNIKKSKLRQEKKFDNKLNEKISAITDDSLMQSILMDTAKTTLQEQLKHDKSNNMQALTQEETVSKANNGINLDGVFKEASNNWSAMAFGNKKNT